ncbi:GGDEF domain-containing protein [Rhodopseudomonas sp. HC1]|uniref:GGDEF domain-containing protein n=1 Tax=Rhodopseudomonas infernalis TaxID=2897386 RepID=UPI001EE82DD1|nr:GGDEF domain-containing protein [Rhodopseudomonas infernalis]MCG6207195.1 GGDEF domain-containing protein [Rhodopseudomonas infernalis]
MIETVTDRPSSGRDRRGLPAAAATDEARNRAAQRRSLIVNLVLNLMAISIDLIALDRSYLASALALRLGVVMPLGLLGLGLNEWSNARTLASAVHALMIVAFVATVVTIGQWANEPYASRYLMVALFLIFFATLLSAVPWRTTLIMTIGSTVVYVAITATGLTWPPTFRNFDLVVCGVVCCLLALRGRRRKDLQIAELNEIRRNDAQLKQSLRQANAALGKLSSTDPLTGAFNRRYLDELIEQDAASSVPSLGHGVLMIDVDHFKLFNDHGGHAAGDICLQRIVAAIRLNVRPSCDIVVRYGGEEFAVVLPGMDEPHLLKAAERLCRAVSDLQIPHPALGPDRVVTVSIGAAIAHPDEGLSDAILRADQSLYRAKRGGRNRVLA